eukprot:292029-Ditylum_brightwellii.AAC.1
MHFARYVQIKSIHKLNVNAVCPPHGKPGYDPCAKYHFLYRVQVDNMNSTTEFASLDQYPQAYCHRHSLQPRNPPLTIEGNMERDALETQML